MLGNNEGSQIDIVAKVQLGSLAIEKELSSKWDRSQVAFHLAPCKVDPTFQQSTSPRVFIKTSETFLSSLDCNFQIELLSKIEVLQVLNDSNILLIGEKRGVLHFINSLSGDMLHSQKICDSPSSDTDTSFAGIAAGKSGDGKDWDLVIVMGSGLIVRLTFPVLEMNVGDTESSVFEELKAGICMEMIESGLTDVLAVSLFSTAPDSLHYRNKMFFNLKTLYQADNVFLIMHKEEGLTLWTRSHAGQTALTMSLSSELFRDSIIKITIDPFSGLVILLGSESWVYLVDLYSFVMIVRKHLPKLINFSLVAANSTDSVDSASSKLISLFDDGNGVESVQWLDIKTLLPLSNALDFPDCDIYFPASSDSESFLSLSKDGEAVFYSCEQSDASSVISRLIKEGHHAEAVSFIRSKNGLTMEAYFKLCLELRSHAVSIEETLSYIQDAKLLNSYAANYEMVEDHESSAECPSTIRIITLVKGALATLGTMECAAMIKQLDVIAHRFVTFTMIDSTKRTFWGNDWHTFRTSNMRFGLQNSIASKDIATALLIIKRHFKDENMLDCLESIMREFPKSLSIESTILLLEELRKECLFEYEYREIIDRWVLEAAEMIEKSERNLKKCVDLLRWAASTPKELSSKKLSAVLSPSYYVSHLLKISQDRKYQESILQKRIQKLILQFENIIELDQVHAFKISLSDYQAVPIENIATSMLDRVAVPELLENCIECQLKPFAAKHGIDLDQILVDYCKEVMDSVQMTTFSTGESRVLKIIPRIKSKNHRISILLDLMRRSPIPWSEDLDLYINTTIESLSKVSSSVDSSHKRSSQSQELQEHFKLMRLKRMLCERYNVKKFNVADITLAKRIVPFILKNVHLVDSINDAILAMEVYHQTTLSQIIFLRACHLVEHGLQERLESLFRIGAECSDSSVVVSLPDDEREDVLKEVSIWITERLNRMQHRKKTSLAYFQSILRSGILIFNLASDSRNMRLFENCLELSSFLNRCFAPNMMDMEDLKLEILFNVLKGEGTEDGRLRVGELLGFSNQFSIYQSARVHAESMEWENVLRRSKELENKFPGPETAEFAYELAILLSATLDGAEPSLKVYNILMEISQISLRNSSRSNVIKILTFCKKVEIFERILQKTDLGAYQSSLSDFSNDANLAPRVVKNYENGLVMSSNSTLPLMISYLKGNKTDDGERSSAYYEQTLEAALKCARDRNYHNALRLGRLLAEDGMTAMIQSIINDCLVNIFQNSLNVCEDLYCKLGLGCLILISSNSSIELLKSNLEVSAKDYKRLRRVAKIGSTAALFLHDNSLHATCVDLIQYSRWMDEFNGLGIPFQHGTLRPDSKTPGGSSQQKKLVDDLLKIRGINEIQFVLDYSRQYLIQDDYVYFEVIKRLCLSNIDLSSHESVTILAHTITLVTDIELLLENMVGYMHSMSPYDYEGLVTILNEISKLSKDGICSYKKNILILGVLADYVRTEPPSSQELLEGEKHDEKAWKYHLSKSIKRLPFHSLLKNPLNVLSSEISESTLPRLMPLAPLLDLDGDKYHEAIIHKKVDVLQKIRNGTIDSFISLSFSDFKLIILKIKDFASAVKTSVYVAGAFPRGQDRIAGYRLALSISERWIAALQKSNDTNMIEKANNGYAKIKSMLGIAQTEFTLQLNGLECLDEFVGNPTALLTKLLTFVDCFSVSASIIHEIATGVATRGSIDLDKFKLLLLQKWLTKNDESLTSPVEERVLFLLHGKFEWGMKHLSSFSNLPPTKISSSARIKALSCLVRLSIIPECSKMDFEKTQNHLQTLLYLTEFEDIGVTQTAAQFESCDKHSLARSLWVSHRGSVKGLRLICRLCLDYNIPDPALGASVFKALLNELDMDFLLDVLEKISSSALFMDLIQVWNEALKLSISNWISSADNDLNFFKYLDFLIKYPSLDAVESVVENLYNHLLCAKSVDPLFQKTIAVSYGLFVLNKQSKLCEWISTLDKEGILNILNTLTPETTAMHSFLIREVFEFVDRKHLYPYILDSSIWPTFLTFLIANDRIERMLMASISEGRKEDALKLFRVYVQTYLPRSREDELLDLLQTYINERGLDPEIDILTYFSDV